MTAIRRYLGEFEAWLLGYGRGKTMVNYDKAIERFLGMFPRKHHPRQFDRMDVCDYKKSRLDAGCSETTVRGELSAIRAFWNWMIRERGLKLVNPASQRRDSFL